MSFLETAWTFDTIKVSTKNEKQSAASQIEFSLAVQRVDQNC